MKSRSEFLPDIPPEQWRWVHRYSNEIEETRHSGHQRWMSQNMRANSCREIMVPIEGDHFYGVQGRLLCARPGSIFLFDGNESRDSSYSPYQPNCRDLWIVFKSPGQALVKDIVCKHLDAQRDDASAVTTSVTMMVEGAFPEACYESWDRCVREEGAPSSLVQLKSAVTALILHAASRHSTSYEQDSDLHKQVVEEISTYIEKNPGEDLSLCSMAKRAGYAPNYFHTIFRRHKGMPLRVFVNSVRLRRAKELIADGYTVQIVSEMVGFATAGYFSRFFKTATALSPGEWRKNRGTYAVEAAAVANQPSEKTLSGDAKRLPSSGSVKMGKVSTPRLRSGFTLLELLIVIAVMLAVASISVSSLRSLGQSKGIAAGASQVAGLLELARSEALVRKTYVWVAFEDEVDQITGEIKAVAFYSVNGTIDPDPSNVKPLTKVIKLKGCKIADYAQMGTRTRELYDGPTVSELTNVGIHYTLPNAKFSGRSITFTPMGEALLVGKPVMTDGFEPAIGFSLKPENSGLQDEIGVVIEGSTGSVRTLRL